LKRVKAKQGVKNQMIKTISFIAIVVAFLPLPAYSITPCQAKCTVQFMQLIPCNLFAGVVSRCQSFSDQEAMAFTNNTLRCIQMLGGGSGALTACMAGAESSSSSCSDYTQQKDALTSIANQCSPNSPPSTVPSNKQ